MEKTFKKRTLAQNRALHKYCSEVSQECINHGITTKVILYNLEVYPNEYTIKDCIRAIGLEKFGKISTSELTTKELQECFEEFRQILIEVTNGIITLSFPSVENTDEYLESLGL